MSFTSKLKNYIKVECDMDMVGIASAETLRSEPEGHRPADLLPGAKCVIVFGRKLADGAVQAAFRALEEKRLDTQSTYAAYAGDLAPNFLMFNETFNLCQYIEDNYSAVAMPLPFGVQQNMVWDVVPGQVFTDPIKQGMPLNIFKAAMAAGLGEFGWSNRFVTVENGPRQILSAVITTLNLDCDEPYNGPKICDPEKCGICSKICPTGAIPSCGGCSKTISVEGKSIEVADLKVNSCIVASMGYRKEFQGRVPVPDLIMTNDPTDEQLKAAFAKKPVNGLSVSHYPNYLCDRCLVYCPLGDWDKRFKETGFTKE